MKATQPRHRQYLSRTAREMTRRTGRKVTEKEVLETLLDLAIQDEAVYDPRDSRPLSAASRDIIQADRGTRSLDLTPEALLAELVAAK